MEYIKQIIKNDVNQLNEDEIDIFKKSIESMFHNLIDSVNNKHQEIEKSIENSYKNLKKSLYFSSTLIQMNELKYYGNQFYPILPEKDKYSYENILVSIKNNESVSIGKLYFEKNYLENIDEKNFYFGTITTDTENYEVKIRLKKFEGYKNEVRNLYIYSQNNFISWTTPNMPFLNSFFEIEAVEFPEGLITEERIVDISFNLEEHEDQYVSNLCPVWSIKKEEKIGSNDPILISNEVFRYKTGLSEDDTVIFINNNYKIYGLDYDSGNNLEITIDKSEIKGFSYYLIKRISSQINNVNAYPIWNNEKTSGFLDSFGSFYNKRIRSYGEIRRIISTMTFAKDYVLKEIYINSRKEYQNKILTYEVNEWIKQDIRDEEKKDLMVLVFQNDLSDSFAYDILSFIVSEIQLLFPEYRCIGEVE